MPSQSAYQPGTHLSRRDVALDNPTEPAMIRVILRRSKTDQLGKGVAVFVGKTDAISAQSQPLQHIWWPEESHFSNSKMEDL